MLHDDPFKRIELVVRYTVAPDVEFKYPSVRQTRVAVVVGQDPTSWRDAAARICREGFYARELRVWLPPHRVVEILAPEA